MWRGYELAPSSPRAFDTSLSSVTNFCLSQCSDSRLPCSAIEYGSNSSCNNLIIEDETHLSKNTDVSLAKAIEAIKDLNLENGESDDSIPKRSSVKEPYNKNAFNDSNTSSPSSPDFSSLWISEDEKSKSNISCTEHCFAHNTMDPSENFQLKWRKNRLFDKEDSSSEEIEFRRIDPERKIKKLSNDKLSVCEIRKKSKKAYTMFTDSDSDLLNKSIESEAENEIKIVEKVCFRSSQTEKDCLQNKAIDHLASPLDISNYCSSVKTRNISLANFIEDCYLQITDNNQSQNSNGLPIETQNRTQLGSTNKELEESKSENVINSRINIKPSSDSASNVDENDSNKKTVKDGENIGLTDVLENLAEITHHFTNIPNSKNPSHTENIQILIETQTQFSEEMCVHSSNSESTYQLGGVVLVNDSRNNDNGVINLESENIMNHATKKTSESLNGSSSDEQIRMDTKVCELYIKPSSNVLKTNDEIKQSLLSGNGATKQTEKEQPFLTGGNREDSESKKEKNKNVKHQTRSNMTSYFTEELDTILSDQDILNENSDKESMEDVTNVNSDETARNRSAKNKNIYSKISKSCGKFIIPAMFKNNEVSLKSPPTKSIKNQTMVCQETGVEQSMNSTKKVKGDTKVGQKTESVVDHDRNITENSHKPSLRLSVGNISTYPNRFKTTKIRRKPNKLNTSVVSGLRRSERLRKKRETKSEVFKECGSLCNSIPLSALAKRKKVSRLSYKSKCKRVAAKGLDMILETKYRALKTFIMSKIQRKFRTDSSVTCDNIIRYLLTIVDPRVNNDNKSAAFSALLFALHEKGICKTVLEFYSFIIIYTPFQVQNDILPLNGYFSCAGPFSNNKISDSITRLYK